MNENRIDFLWRHMARPDTPAHRVDQVLMNINDDLMKERNKRGEQRRVKARLWRRMCFKKLLEEFKYRGMFEKITVDALENMQFSQVVFFDLYSKTLLLHHSHCPSVVDRLSGQQGEACRLNTHLVIADCPSLARQQLLILSYFTASISCLPAHTSSSLWSC